MNPIFLIYLVSLYAASALAAPADLKEKFEKEISGSRVKPSHLGLVVSYFSNGKPQPLYSLNESKLMSTASASKVITGAAVMDLLGPGKKFVTRLMSSAPVVEGVLQGDLYLKGGGDAGFVSETLWFLVNEFRRTEIKTVKGAIIVDDSRFDKVRADDSRDNDSVDRAYNAPVGAMSFNWNSVNVFVRPTAAGQPAKVFIDPENSYVKLKGAVKTGAAGSRNTVKISRTSSKTGDVIHVSGAIPAGSDEKVYYKNITNPALWSGWNLLEFLKQRGIEVKGGVREGIAAADTKILAEAESKPVALQVADMMKFSNNYVAEMLTKNLVAEKARQPASLAKGVELVRQYLVDSGLPKDGFNFENPSGLTRQNKIRPADLHRFLAGMVQRFSSFPENLSALALAGVDGTLERRMVGTRAVGRIRAKTGTMTGVSALVGYAGRDDGTLLTFVFMFNGPGELDADARKLFDKLAVRMVE